MLMIYTRKIEEKMAGRIEGLQRETVAHENRTRHPFLLDGIRVDYYNTPTR
jgi:ribosome recycling factor